MTGDMISTHSGCVKRAVFAEMNCHVNLVLDVRRPINPSYQFPSPPWAVKLPAANKYISGTQVIPPSLGHLRGSDMQYSR